MTIRTARTADAPGCATVYARSWRAAFGSILTPEIVPDDTLHERGAAFAHAPLCLVATTEDTADATIIGIAAGDPATGQLDILYVNPTHWGTQTGSKLLTAATNILTTDDHTPWLWAWEDNHRALTYYTRHGWSPTNTQRTTTIGGHDFHYRQLVARCT